MKHIANRASTLLEVLQEMAPDSSKNTLRSWLKIGRVCVNNQVLDRANAAVTIGQEITIGSKISFIRGDIRIIHEDERIVVLEKPDGLLSVASEKQLHRTVHGFLKRRFHSRRVYPVHRLDRETSGVMLFVYDEEARDDLKGQFEKHLVDKTYYAIVEKQMLQKSGTWESYLEEDDFLYVKSTNNSVSGKLAITSFEVLKTKQNFSLLRLKPKSGRKNQLRVHCSEAGHPILGDKKYGSKGRPERLCLHAQRLSFKHPGSGQQMTFSTPLPTIFHKSFNLSDLIL